MPSLYSNNRRIAATRINKAARAFLFRRRMSTNSIIQRRAKAARRRRTAILSFKKRFGFRNKYI